jgi:hypothetical protein
MEIFVETQVAIMFAVTNMTDRNILFTLRFMTNETLHNLTVLLLILHALCLV